MSTDIMVYIDNISNISKQTCDEYLNRFGMMAEMHPQINFKELTGFLPFRVQLKTEAEFLKGRTLVSGFEFSTSPYKFSEEKKEGSRKGLKALFSKQLPVYGEKIDEILSKCNYTVTLCFGSADSLELRMALSFAAYLVDTCNGIMLDPQSGEWYYDNVAKLLYQDIQDFESNLTAENCSLHEFTEWL